MKLADIDRATDRAKLLLAIMMWSAKGFRQLRQCGEA